ncbi:HET-domain-containing protein [Stipitochalara longipes BDJ]|nr:HET-domain-containing protein [Stipitochalara longipes BDJ]
MEASDPMNQIGESKRAHSCVLLDDNQVASLASSRNLGSQCSTYDKLLCRACQFFFQGSFSAGWTYDFKKHHSRFEDMEKSAFGGCYICKAIRSYWVCKRGYAPMIVPKAEGSNQKNANENYFTSYSLGKANDPAELYLTFQVEGLKYYDDHLRFILGKGSGFQNQTVAKTPMGLAREWLSKCLGEHSCCNHHALQTSNLQPPKRLLDLDMPAQAWVRLWCRSSSKETPIPQYMTLSHCWGTAQFLKLTTGTLQRLMDGVLVSELPQTFQDAIWVARELGAKFIWIDSLCIIQDCVSDWQQEASLMADVYQGSLCNIAASGASDANAGCHSIRERPLIQPCVVRTAWEDYANDEWSVHREPFWSSLFENDRLRSRGWVIQELLLAPRILHLGKSQIFWECYDENVCEEYPSGGPRGPQEYRKKHITAITREKHSNGGGTGASWSNLILDYTTCNLTEPKDKLIALSSVVKVLQIVFQDEYIAGLWRKDLPCQFLWRPFTEDGILIPTKDYRAPSWSWACVDGLIDCSPDRSPKNGDTTLVKIIDFPRTALGDDPTGEVSSGLLRLAGRLSTIELQTIDIQPQSGSRFRFRFHEPYENWYPDGIIATIFASSIIIPRNLHCMPIIRKQDKECGSRYHCLLLIPTHTERGQFQRW